MSDTNPEIGRSVVAAGLKTNYLEAGEGEPVVLIHGSGPGVTAYANWRLAIPVLSQKYRVLAPDIAGFGYTERKEGVTYNLDFWVQHLTEWLDAVGVKKARFVGNSFGGALTLALTVRRPELVDRFVLMGAAGVDFEVTPGLDAVWGYEPSIENMREIAKSFAYDTSIITDDLVKSRYEASIRPGFQESYSKLFAAPRQRHAKALATPEADIRKIEQRALVIHGRDDKIVPLTNSYKLHSLIPRSDLHVFGQCGHWTQIERKDAFLKLVMDFFAS
jgi:2-hydroxymuconate-semialdehyde hydrolase